MGKREPRIRRPAKLDGEHSFLHVRVATAEKKAFIEFCRARKVGASQVIREAMEAIAAGQWTPPALRAKPGRKPAAKPAGKTSGAKRKPPAPRRARKR